MQGLHGLRGDGDDRRVICDGEVTGIGTAVAGDKIQTGQDLSLRFPQGRSSSEALY